MAVVGTPLLVTGGGGVGVDFFLVAGFFLVLGFGLGSVTLLPAWEVPGLSGVVFWVVGLPEPFEPEVGEGFLVVEVDDVEEDEPEPGDFGLGVVDVEVEVEVEVVCDWVLVVTVAAGVVAVTGGQDCETLVIGRLTGSGSELGGVPGATFWKVKVWPPETVMTTVQPSADAFGSAARPRMATMHPMVTAAMVSFRFVNTVACSSRGMPRAKSSSELRSQVGLSGRYKLPPSFAIGNRRCGGCLFGYQRRDRCGARTSRAFL